MCLCISYKTPLSALAGIRARCPRARSAQGQSARIPQSTIMGCYD